MESSRYIIGKAFISDGVQCEISIEESAEDVINTALLDCNLQGTVDIEGEELTVECWRENKRGKIRRYVTYCEPIHLEFFLEKLSKKYSVKPAVYSVQLITIDNNEFKPY
ncbi:hypothetical protein AWB71_02570 [Caballeronia peredens]|nr:hypothetical protein AWB71_02570 [Caballeronia peredens]